MSDGTKQLLIRLPESEHRALKVKCAQDGKPIAAVVGGLISGYLAGTVKFPRKGSPRSAA